MINRPLRAHNQVGETSKQMIIVGATMTAGTKLIRNTNCRNFLRGPPKGAGS